MQFHHLQTDGMDSYLIMEDKTENPLGLNRFIKWLECIWFHCGEHHTIA